MAAPLLATLLTSAPVALESLFRGPSALLSVAHGGCAKSASWLATASLSVSAGAAAALVDGSRAALFVANAAALAYHSVAAWNFAFGPRSVARDAGSAVLVQVVLAAWSLYGLWATRRYSVWSKRS